MVPDPIPFNKIKEMYKYKEDNNQIIIKTSVKVRG